MCCVLQATTREPRRSERRAKDSGTGARRGKAEASSRASGDCLKRRAAAAEKEQEVAPSCKRKKSAATPKGRANKKSRDDAAASAQEVCLAPRVLSCILLARSPHVLCTCHGKV